MLATIFTTTCSLGITLLWKSSDFSQARENIQFSQFEFDVSGVHFKKALFVPNISVYNKVWSSALPPTDLQVDLSWQLTLQKVWENLINSQKGITVTYNMSFSWLECRIRDIFCQHDYV